MRAIVPAADQIEAGQAKFAIAAGFESMTNAPCVLPDYRSRRYGDISIKNLIIFNALWDVHMGEMTEQLMARVGDQYDVSRKGHDRYALKSHQRASESIERGRSILSWCCRPPNGLVESDEGPRPQSTLEDLKQLNPAFRQDGTVTPANASKLSDGAYHGAHQYTSE